MRKVFKVLTIAALFFSMPCSVHAIAGSYFTGAAHSLNNDIVGIDYKLTEEEQKKYVEDLQYSFLSKLDLDESGKYINPSTERMIDFSADSSYGDTDYNKAQLNDIVVSKAYLLNNNLLERKASIYYDSGSGLFYSQSYEDLSESWNNGVHNKIADALEALGGMGGFNESSGAFNKIEVSSSIKTKSDVIAVANDVTDEIVKGDLLEDLSGAGAIEEDDIAEVIDTIKKRRKQMKKEVNAEEELKDACSVGVDYLEWLEDYSSRFAPPVLWSDESSVTKTELMVLLAKAAIGVQPSRQIAWSAPSVRNGKTYSQSTSNYWDNGQVVSMLGGYWDTGQYKGSANFESGDIYYYVSSNVYELYLKELLDRGLIYIDELGKSKAAKKFKQEYLEYEDSLPAWSSAQGVSAFGVKDSLGAGYSLQGDVISCNNVRFFGNESLTTMEIYQYVEDFLRTTEDDITETETDIVMFKYGLDYLAPYSGSKLKTLQFLAVKGILNFENPEEFYNLDEPMTYSRLYQILYRIHSKDARYDFSQVQLTDGESYWMSKGYAENTVAYTDSASSFVMSDDAVEEMEDEEEETADNGLDDFFNIQSVHAVKKTWITTFKLSTDLDWKFAGTSLSEMVNGTPKNSSVKSIKKKKMSYNGTTTDIYVLKVAHSAESAASALKWSRNQLTTTSGSRDGVETIVKVTEDGKAKESEYSMISQTALRKSFSAVSVMQDKVLVNTNTGTQAILFNDLKCAWVGNTIVYTDGLIYDEANDEIYYNLKVIMALLDDTFMEKTGIKSAIFYTPKKFVSNFATVKTEYDDAFSKAECLTFKATQKMENKYSDSDGISKGDNLYYYKVDDMSDGINTVMRKFSLSGKGDCWLIVDWEFVIPSLQDMSDNEDIAEAISTIFSEDGSTSKKNLKRSTIVKAFYTRPTGSPILEAWWDSNYFVNNAIMNHLLNTKGVEYVTSGYLTPSITVLGPNSKSFKDHSDEWLTDIFKGIDFKSYSGKTDDGTSDGANNSVLTSYINNEVNGGWFKPFYSESAFEGAFQGGVVDDPKKARELLTGMVTAYRHLNYYSSNNFGDQGSFFGLQYFITKAGVVYRGLASEDRLTYGTKKVSGNKVVKTLKLATREPETADPKKGSKVVFSGKDINKKGLIYDGTATLGEGENAEECYTFSPAQDLIHLNPNDELYNGAYVGVNIPYAEQNSNGGSTLKKDSVTLQVLLDRGVDSNKNANKLTKYSSTGTVSSEIPRYSKTNKMYNKWGKKLFGNGILSKASTIADEDKFYCSKTVAGSEWGNYVWVSPSDKVVSDMDKSDVPNLNICSESKALEFYKDWYGEQVEQYLTGESVKFLPENGAYDWSSMICRINNSIDPWYLGLPSSDLDNSAGLYLYGRTGYGLDIINKYNGNRDDYSSTGAGGSIFQNDASAFAEGITDRKCDLVTGENVVNSANVAIAVPLFYLPVDQFSIIEVVDGSSSQYEIVKGGVLTAFSFSNLYYSGIMKSVQETVIAAYVKTVTLDQLKQGNTVNIEGVRYFVDEDEHSGKGVWLTSACLNVNSSSKARAELRDLALNWDSNKKKFQNRAVNDLLGSTFITCDGYAYPLTGYVVNRNDKMPKAGVQVGGKKDTKAIRKNGLIYWSEKEEKLMGFKMVSKGVKTDKPITKKNSSEYQYFRVRFYLNGKLRVRPLNADNTKFVLTTTTVSGNITSSSEKFQYFNEELNRVENLYSSLEAVSSKFNPSPMFAAVKAAFMREFHKTMGNDVRTWVLMIICVVCSYLSVMSWIAYLILHYNVLHSLFSIIASGRNGTFGNGFDAVKFFTLGLFRIEDDPPLHRVVIIQFVCVAVAALCVMLT